MIGSFAKMHGLGNDFVVVEARDEGSEPLGDLARRLCDRHFGVGGDGLIVWVPPRQGDLGMRMFNPDGSEAQMCGNGLRCLAGYARSHFPDRDRLRIDTLAGLLEARFDGPEETGRGQVEVDMGAPRLLRGEIPMRGEAAARVLEEALDVDGHRYQVTAVSMGNPHCVLFLDAQRGTAVDGLELAQVPLETLGPRFETHAAFPEHTNVEFVTLVGRDELAVRVWERGAGATLACGTGACATMVAAFLTGRVGRRANVHLPGGTLRVEWPGEGAVRMTGPYQWVFKGELGAYRTKEMVR